MKVCSTCKEQKTHSFFVKSPQHRDGFHGVCKPCRNKQRQIRGRPTETPEKRFAWRIKSQYGLTTDDFLFLLKSQESKCKICEETLHKPFVDHCHRTNKVRGLLCHNCNAAIGLFKENIQNLNNAIDYLEYAGY